MRTMIKMIGMGLLWCASATPCLAVNKHGLGLTLGYEGTLGNALTYHYLFDKTIEFFGGLGYNSTGPKVGGGADYLWFWHRSFGMRFGSALVVSTGGSGEVVIDANFLPDGTTQKEAISASKQYEVTTAVMLNSLIGGFWDITNSFGFIADVTYNAVLAGGDVTLSKDIKYSRDIEATNQDHFERQFDEKAKDKAIPGGLGFSVGARLRF